MPAINLIITNLIFRKNEDSDFFKYGMFDMIKYIFFIIRTLVFCSFKIQFAQKSHGPIAGSQKNLI